MNTMDRHQVTTKAMIFNNWIVLATIIPIVATFFVTFFIDFSWDNEIHKKILINSSFAYGLICVTIWMVTRHHFLFQKNQWIRNLIVIVASCVVVLWTYKHKITFRFDILLLLLTGLYVIVYRKWTKPNAVILSFLAFVLLKYIGLLWSKHIEYAWEMVKEEMLIFSLLVPVISFGFRVNAKEQHAFIAICFKMFLFLLASNFIFYLIYIDFSNNQLFNFFTFDKGYMNFYEIIGWSYFFHPSFISWVFLLIGGLGIFVWKKNHRLISLGEIVLYAVLLLCFVFMMQARVAILGYFIAVMYFMWLRFGNVFSSRMRYVILSVGGLLSLVAIAFLTTRTSYFSDPIRNNTFQIIANQLSKGNLLWGDGTATQRFIMKDTGIFHVHNDFLSILIDLGIIGLGLFLFWIISILKTKEHIAQYTLLIFLLIMNTDVLFCFYLGTYITTPFLFFIFFAKTEKTSI